MEHTSLLTIELLHCFLVSGALSHGSVIHLFRKMARKVDEAANFVSVQLTEQELGIYDATQTMLGGTK
jgi:predicted nucleic acid-binding protein